MFSKLMRNEFDMQRNYRNLWQNDFVAKLPVSISALPQFHPVFYMARKRWWQNKHRAFARWIICRIMHFISLTISSTVEPPLSVHPLLSGQ